MRKSSWFCALVGFFVGSRAWSLLLSSRAAVRRVSVSLTRNELEGQHPSDAAGSGRLSVPVLCFRDLSVVANALKAGCRARAPHLGARADGPRPPSRRERATRSQTGALLLSAPAAARQGDGVSGEARGARGAGLRPRLRGAAPRAPGVLVLGGTGRSRRGPLLPRSRESGGGFCPAAVRSLTGWAGGRFPTARAGARRPGTPVRGRAGAGVRRSVPSLDFASERVVRCGVGLCGRPRGGLAGRGRRRRRCGGRGQGPGRRRLLVPAPGVARGAGLGWSETPLGGALKTRRV